MVRHRRPHRRARRGAALISAVVFLLVISTLTVTVLSTRVTHIGLEVSDIHRVHAEAAAQGALHLAAHRILVDSELQDALTKVIDNDSDTWATGDEPPFEFDGTLSDTSFTVSAWPREFEIVLRAVAESNGVFATRWSYLPVGRKDADGEEQPSDPDNNDQNDFWWLDWHQHYYHRHYRYHR